MNHKISDVALIAALVLPLSVSLNTGTVQGTYSSTGEQMTPSATATPSGGVAPYSYEWVDQGGGAVFAANAPTSATTFWRIFATFPNGYTATWKCQVTDATGRTALSSILNVLEVP